MRRAFTIGIDNKGDAVILKDHNHALREHKAGLKEVVGEFKEVFILETSKANKKKAFSVGGNVNAKAALLVSEQKGKGSEALADQALGVMKKGKPEGHVHFETASLTVAEQTGRSPVRSRKRRKIARAKRAAAPKQPAAASTSPDATALKSKDEGQFGGGPASSRKPA